MLTKLQTLKAKLQTIEDIDDMFPELNMFQHELHNASYSDESTLLYWCLDYVDSHNGNIDDVATVLRLIERLLA